MKIVIADDQIEDLIIFPQSADDVQVEPVHVEWEDKGGGNIVVTHSSAREAARDILSRKPDVIFLDHTFGFAWLKGRQPETGEDVASALRSQGFKGRLVGFSSKKENQPYCDTYSGKETMPEISWLLGFCKSEVEKPTLATEASSKP